ncbi:putative Response regulator receiver domain-containing protein [Candidatus Terasakiella magnetica]|uniref:Putative Response regulator receiver domain-containing protein n=1 Tax=Candidatus Terasakiella magnetica TaxID=1867952 RepID=A0A1C3RGV0_9PROT|nr:response regulator [Candidatus Terasakiella magnetica]SCA56478.1 putative Response regulator receiver domain-containing protein [Candidatus Terasakiella magnetica]
MAKILVAEDVAEIRFAYETILSAEGHEVTTATNGKEASDFLNQSDFDLVLTDLLMPEGDGLSVASFAHKLENRPKLLVITGGGDRISPYEALKMGEFLFDVSMVKPVNAQDLLQAVRKMIN